MSHVYKKINGTELKDMLLSGYKALEEQYLFINDLNVFPVPDGDTGTNMKLTYFSGLNAIGDATRLDEVISRFSRGCLFGARGNSGVLLSQYFKGLAQSFEGKAEVDVKEFANGLKKGYKMAYDSAINPVEGTILTVAREGVENVLFDIDNETDFLTFIEKVIRASNLSLENTPNLLAVLRENGVIDSGGKGLLTILEGFERFFNDDKKYSFEFENEHEHEASLNLDFSLFNENSEFTYGYCTEFLLQLLNSKMDVKLFDIEKFIKEISKFGDSLLCTQNGTVIKVHIHTKKPSEVIEFAQTFGEFLTIKMENMTLQNNNVKKNQRKENAIICIANGDGIIDLFKKCGATIVLNGGQTMNTSVTELLDAFESANADNIILLPNNKNILLAAKSAIEIYKDSKIYLVETNNIQQGYYGLMTSMVSEPDAETLFEQINENSKMVISAFVAKTSKDALIDDVETKKGEYIESVDDVVVGSSINRKDAVLDMISKIEGIDDKEIMFIIYGQDVSLEEVNEVKEELENRYPYLEVGLIEGKQDIRDYLIGVNL